MCQLISFFKQELCSHYSLFAQFKLSSSALRVLLHPLALSWTKLVRVCMLVSKLGLAKGDVK